MESTQLLGDLELVPVVDAAHIEQVAEMAADIWRDHYTPIIGAAQVEYMLKHLQSAGAMAEQIQRGMRYYLINHRQQPTGYLAIECRESTLFISKLYLLKVHRGKRIAVQVIAWLEALATRFGLSGLELTVNKHNTQAIDAYLRLGFKQCESVCIDIGEGFVMDDYRLQKDIY